MVGSLINKKDRYVIKKKDTNIASRLSEIATKPSEIDFKAFTRVKVAHNFAEM